MSADPSPADAVNRVVDIAVRLGALALLGAWCLTLLAPFAAVAIWGAVLAVAAQPAHAWLSRALGGREALAAGLLSVAALALILGPVSVLATSFVAGVESLARAFSEGRIEAPPPPEGLLGVPFVGARLHAFWSLAATNLSAALQQLAPLAGETLGGALAAAGAAGLTVLQFAAATIVAGALLPRGPWAQEGIERLVDRLAPARGAAFVALAAQTVRNVARGVIGVALLQGLLLGLAFLVAGIPLAGLWTFAAIALAIVQVGAGPIALGTAVYAWTQFDTLSAALFTAWVVAASLVDNVLKPILMARGLPTPMVVIVLGLLGGALAHGLIGLFVGPIVLAIGYDLLRVWVGAAVAAEAR